MLQRNSGHPSESGDEGNTQPPDHGDNHPNDNNKHEGGKTPEHQLADGFGAWIMPLVLILIGGYLAIRYEVLGRGAAMLWVYPFAIVVQAIFGTIALGSAMGILNLPWRGVRRAMLRVASLYIALDAIRSLSFEWPFGTVALQACGLLVLMFVMFRFRWAVLVFVGSILFLVKVVARQVIEQTFYTWF